jgi:hypothetical protein
MRCSACGVEVMPEAVFCHQCGRRIQTPDENDRKNEPDGGAPATKPAEMAGSTILKRPESSGNAGSTFVEHRDSAEPPEIELWHGGYSPKAMLGGWVISASVTVALLVGGFLWMPGRVLYWSILLIVMILPWAYYFSVLSYRRMNVRYLLTTQRFVHEQGIFRRVTDRIEVLEMNDIAFEQGPVERLAGVGTIRIVSSDHTHPQFDLPGIDNVREVAELFDDARRNERRRRGLHIEQI